MAGMLPGVEAARRRRFHRSSEPFPAAPGYGSGSTRRSSFCLYATSRDHHLPTSAASELQARSKANEALFDESQLSAVAREAKKRLDERLQQHHRKSQKSSIMSSTGNDEAHDSSKSGQRHVKKRINWLKLRWKLRSEEEECAVCLGQLVWEEEEEEAPIAPIAIGLAHKVHIKCLDANPHCICCSMSIPSSSIRLQIER